MNEISKDPMEWIKGLDVIKEGALTSNKQIKDVVNKSNNKKAKEFGDIESTPEQRLFVANIHKVIGKSLKQFNKSRRNGTELELTMEIRQSSNGSMTISRAFLSELGASFSLSPGTSFIGNSSKSGGTL